MITIVGLENEGGRGKFARHAVAARFLDFVASVTNATWIPAEKTESAIITVNGKDVVLLRQTKEKLHNCGEILVPQLLTSAPTEIIIVYDEAALEEGEIAFADEAMWFGGGHLGLSNIDKELGSSSFIKAAIGIGSIPSRDKWEEFFNSELDPATKNLIQTKFDSLWQQIVAFVSAEQASLKNSISNEIAISSQLPHRERNLAISPVLIVLPQAHIDRVNQGVSVLIQVIQRTMGKYAALLHDCEDPWKHELVELLERGIPEQMRPLVRIDGAKIDHVSFDFHKGKLLEINAAPLPPLVVSRMANQIPGAIGDQLSLEQLTERVRLMAKRRFKVNSTAQILLVDEIGGFKLGKTGWIQEVFEYLNNEGFNVIIGSTADNPAADVIWANITWMTPERWPDVITDKAMMGEARIFPSPRNFLFTSKWFLRLLSNAQSQRILEISSKEADILAEILPWTGSLPESEDVIAMLLRNNLKTYAKPFLSSGGRGGQAISKLRDLSKVSLPAVVQEWTPPYEIPELGLYHDLRVVVYGTQGQVRIWGSRVWSGGMQIQRPMDAPVLAK